MAKYSKAAHEEASLWIRRINAAQRVFEDGHRERDKYRDAANLDFPILVPGIDANQDDALGGDFIDQIDINLSRRYIDWLQSQATDEEPIIMYPRDAEGDEELAAMNEKLLGRVASEARAVAEFRDGITNICTQGSTAIWVGVHAEVVTREQVAAMATGAGDATEASLAGLHLPQDGHDHEASAQGLAKAANDPHSGLAPEQRQAALADALEHVDMKAEEAQAPQALRTERGKCWVRRLPIGTWTVWDHSVWEIKDARWMARKLVMTIEEAQATPLFNRRVLAKVKAIPLTKEQGYEPVQRVGLSEQEVPFEDNRIVIWEVWDKRWSTRHYVNDSVDDYLELDESNPYWVAGEPLIPHFFPCRVIAPLKSDEEKPERTLGIPLLALGWPQQEELIKLRSFRIAQVKRHSVRMYEIDPEVDEDTAAAISMGIDGTMVTRPAGVDPGKVLLPIQFTGQAHDILQEAMAVKQEWLESMGMPASDLTSVPQADTATQELQGIQAGRQQAGDIVRQLEIAFADVLEMLRGMVRGFYTTEQVMGLLGAKFAEQFKAWKRTSLAGDRLQIRFAARAKAENSVRTNQLMQAYQILKQELDPFTGMQKYKTDHILEELLRGLNVGGLIENGPELEMAMQAMQAQQAEGGQPSSNGKSEGGPKQPGPTSAPGQPAPGDTSGPATTGTLMSRAARSRPSAPGPGQGMQ